MIVMNETSTVDILGDLTTPYSGVLRCNLRVFCAIDQDKASVGSTWNPYLRVRAEKVGRRRLKISAALVDPGDAKLAISYGIAPVANGVVLGALTKVVTLQ